MNQPPPPPKRHSFRPLLFAPPQGADAMPRTSPPRPAPGRSTPPVLPKPPRLPAEGRRGAGESHVRLRAMPVANIDWLDAQDLLDELCEDQLTLSMNLACLEQAVEGTPRLPATRSALSALQARLVDLGVLRDALAAVQLRTADPRVHRLFLPDAPLADYLRGLYAWAHAVVRALDQLAAGVRAAKPDWAMLRWRLEEAKNFHFDELHEPIRADLAALAVLEGSLAARGEELAAGDLERAVEHLLAVAGQAVRRLDERFG